MLEKEPNDTIKEATPAELPMALNGILEKPGDVDFFKFKVKKGETYEVECYGRRIRSAIDPVMILYNAAGQGLVANDDSRGPDPYFRFTAPADGEYFLSVYRPLAARRAGIRLSRRVPTGRAEGHHWLAAGRAVLAVASADLRRPRQQVRALMSAGRENFGGDLLLDPTDMPTGIKMIADPMPANASTMPVVFEAAKDAPLAGSLVDLQARVIDPKQKITADSSITPSS